MGRRLVLVILVYVLAFLVMVAAEALVLDAATQSTNASALQALNVAVALIAAVVVDRVLVRARRI